MSDQSDESTARAGGAEGGPSSSDEFEYELVAIEEDIDTAWESGEVHPKREFPRVGFGRSGQHPEALPPRVYLTNRPTCASPSRGVQTEPPQEQLLEGPQQRGQGGEPGAQEQQVGPLGRSGQHPEALPPRVYLTNRPTGASPSRGVQTEPPQEQLLEGPQQRGQGGQAAVEDQQQLEMPRGRRLSQRLREIKLLSSHKDSPSKK